MTTLALIAGLLSSAPALAGTGTPQCDSCKICGASLLVALADNGFTGTVEGVNLIECFVSGCEERDVSGDLALPLYAGGWDDATLSPSPTALFAYIELTYCASSSGCYPSQLESVTYDMYNCDL